MGRDEWARAGCEFGVFHIPPVQRLAGPHLLQRATEQASDGRCSPGSGWHPMACHSGRLHSMGRHSSDAELWRLWSHQEACAVGRIDRDGHGNPSDAADCCYLPDLSRTFEATRFLGRAFDTSVGGNDWFRGSDNHTFAFLCGRGPSHQPQQSWNDPVYVPHHAVPAGATGIP